MSEDINADQIKSIELITASRTNRGSEYDWTPNTNRWTKGDNDRLYFNDSQFIDYIDLTTGFAAREGGAVTISTDLNGDELSIDVEVYEKTYSASFKLIGLESDKNDEDGDDDDTEELIADGGGDAASHIGEGEIEAAIESNDNVDGPNAFGINEVRDALAEIQQSFERFWPEHMDSIEDGHLEVVAESERTVVFADHTGQGWNEELDALGLDRDGEDAILRAILVETHHRAASRITDHPWATADAVVVSKPAGTRNGQLFVEAIVNNLCKRGLSPGQAWGYYGVEIRENSRNSWAEKCGYSDHSAVSEAVRKAKTKLSGA